MPLAVSEGDPLSVIVGVALNSFEGSTDGTVEFTIVGNKDGTALKAEVGRFVVMADGTKDDETVGTAELPAEDGTWEFTNEGGPLCANEGVPLLAVPEGGTLLIAKGERLFFKDGASLEAIEGCSLFRGGTVDGVSVPTNVGNEVTAMIVGSATSTPNGISSAPRASTNSTLLAPPPNKLSVVQGCSTQDHSISKEIVDASFGVVSFDVPVEFLVALTKTAVSFVCNARTSRR